MTVLRSLLFVPGNQPKMLEKALNLTPDAFIPDLEDSVPREEKLNARHITVSFLSQFAETGRPVIPRVNSLDTGLLEGDLKALVGPHISGISVGKANNPEVLRAIDAILISAEQYAGLETGTVKLIPWIETAEAVIRAYEICNASSRIIGVAFGAEDYTTDMAIERLGNEGEIEYPRAVIGVAARATNIQAFDTPYFSFKDSDGLRGDCHTARLRGFTGKFAIHPAQITPINESFAPSTLEIEQARLEVVTYERAARVGKGSTSLNNKVVDMPVYKRALNLLERAESPKLIDIEAE